MTAIIADSDKMTAKANGNATPAADIADTEGPADSSQELGAQLNGDVVGKVALVGAIGVGAALIEASLIPGIIVGAVAVLAPKFLPEFGSRLRPLFKQTIRGAYKLQEKTREAFAEAQEHVQDMMAEARHEGQEAESAAKSATELSSATKA